MNALIKLRSLSAVRVCGHKGRDYSAQFVGNFYTFRFQRIATKSNLLISLHLLFWCDSCLRRPRHYQTREERKNMKRVMSYTNCIISLGIGSISCTALAQTTANGPYYATPSWEQ